jgi:hypothetical protein
MTLSRIRHAIPWRIALILALVPCLPLLAFWGWSRLEVPPLQRYYLAAYWHSSEAAKQPGAQTQIQWLMETAPGRKRHWLFAPDVTEGGNSDVPLELSSFAVEQGWTGIERTAAESMDSAELEKLLREDFYDGESFRRLVHEPLIYCVVAWVIVACLAFMMRQDIGYEWRQFRREVVVSEWSSNYGGDWPENREGIGTRIRMRITRWNADKNVLRVATNIKTLMSRFGLKHSPNAESALDSNRTPSTEVQAEVPAARQHPNPLPSDSPEPPSQRRTIFPGMSPTDAAHSKPKPWDESEWID